MCFRSPAIRVTQQTIKHCQVDFTMDLITKATNLIFFLFKHTKREVCENEISIDCILTINDRYFNVLTVKIVIEHAFSL